MKQIGHIEYLVIEITRRCNMTCLHCLRGDAENVNIDIKHVETLFKNLGSIGTLTITGGEPSLYPEMIDQITKVAKKNNVEIYNFYMVTNAKKVTNGFMNAVLNLYLYCTDNEMSQLMISNDGYHDEADRQLKMNYEKLLAFRFAAKKEKEDGTYFDENQMIASGRAEMNFPGRDNNFWMYDIDEDENSLLGGDIYLNCYGDILPNCDLSYENQRNKNLILGNVQDKNFNLIKAIKDFNKKIEKLEERTIDELSCVDV
jgi:organic radical activating enzyme